MEYQKVHIGSLIKSEVKHRGMTYSDFAGRIGIQRQNVESKVFKKQGLNTSLLIQISEILNCDFFKYFQTRIDKQPSALSNEKLKIDNENIIYNLNGQTTATRYW